MDSFLVKHCSPTLAGLKSGNLFNLQYDCREKLISIVKSWNSILNRKGVFIRLLDINDNRGLVYVYRLKKIEQDLKSTGVRNFLELLGYNYADIHSMLDYLSERIKGEDNFPHEIGLFLGYPLADVKGFISHKGKDCKCVGYWKVYSNEELAKCLFARFQRCTEIYCRKLKEGTSILRLTVAA